MGSYLEQADIVVSTVSSMMTRMSSLFNIDGPFIFFGLN
jgi:hypothetical protein